MVSSTSNSSTTAKNTAKVPASSIKSPIEKMATVSPTYKSLEDEVIYLRSQNKVLKNALDAVKDTASEKLSKSYELVWYAKNRTRFPAHKASKWLDNSKEHRNDIENLRGINGDFHHGFNSGMLAASRLFKEHADVPSLDTEGPFHSSCTVAAEHKEKIEASKKSFPDVGAEDFPSLPTN